MSRRKEPRAAWLVRALAMGLLAITLTPQEAGARARVWQALRTCGQDLTQVRFVILEGDRQTFDRVRLEFGMARAPVLGPRTTEEQ